MRSRAPRLALLALVAAALGAPAVAQQQAQANAEAASAERSERREAARPVAALEFSAQDVQAQDLLGTAADLGAHEFVARMEADPTAGGASGRLVFEGLETFANWRETQRDSFFAPLDAGRIETRLTLFRPGLLRRGDPQAEAGSVSVRYVNSDNDAAGDADMDAVTVVCPGDDAECSPSN